MIKLSHTQAYEVIYITMHFATNFHCCCMEDNNMRFSAESDTAYLEYTGYITVLHQNRK
jgi:hypothetical protein